MHTTGINLINKLAAVNHAGNNNLGSEHCEIQKPLSLISNYLLADFQFPE